MYIKSWNSFFSFSLQLDVYILTLIDSPGTSLQLSQQFEQRKFTRRDDLTTAVRMQIAIDALHAMQNSVHGTITTLSKKANVSRTFIYSLCATLKEAGQCLFGHPAAGTAYSLPREQAIEAILSFRLEGGNSLGAISTILNRFGFAFSSVGFISQTLSRIGSLLPMTIATLDKPQQYIVFASDEIFSKSQPILITVDPCSSAIIRIERSDSRKAEDWAAHFKAINNNGFQPLFMVSDDGQGLCAAHKAVMSDTLRQSDTYHAIAHRLGNRVHRLEEAAYKAIKEEQTRETLFNSAKSQAAQEKRRAAYQQAIKAADKAIELYDSFHYLYLNLIGELNLFDYQGVLRDRQLIEEMILLILSLIKELNHPKINTAVDQIKRALPDLLHYVDIAKTIVYECQQLPINEACLKEIFLAWQWSKSFLKAKKTGRKNQARRRQQYHLDNAEYLSPKAFTDIQVGIYAKLDKIVQSSAMVECINSIIRPYLNSSKNQLTQEQLNLIMFYHNHRRYRAGKRKHKTPMELLTGKEQTDDWISLLFDKLREKDPELLLAA